ncbi:MAG TPA: hypothetical protein VM925_23365 [Labilithrix sp.]|nr:hypothetical protein [Labilithrix sp.]
MAVRSSPIGADALRNVADSKLVFRVALAISIAAVVVPILATPYLPFTDAPEHAAVMATLRFWSDPTYSGAYELAIFRSQYLVYHLAGAGLTAVVGDAALASRLLLVVAGVTLPLSFRALLRAAGRDERLALFACLPFWSRALVIGFLPFVASIPIAFAALALAIRLVRKPSRKGAVVLALLAVILFYAHVSTWMIFVVSAGAVMLFARRARALVALVPSGVAAGAWLLLGKLTLGAGTLADASETTRMRLGRSLLAMPLWLFDVWQAHGDELAAAFWWTAFLGVVLASARAVGRYSRRMLVLLYLPFACVLVVYVATPWRVGAAAMLNVRLAPILVLLAFLPMRLPRRSAVAAVALGLAFGANVIGGLSALRECRAAKNELGDLDAVLDAMPPGSRVMTLSFDMRTRATHYYPWGHVAAYHRVRRGGVASFSFSELKHWPIHYAPAHRPPPKEGAAWDLHPCSYRNAIDGPYYDFVLVRGDVDPFASSPPGPVFRPALIAKPMTLYRKESGTWPARDVPDEGPCPKRPQDPTPPSER